MRRKIVTTAFALLAILSINNVEAQNRNGNGNGQGNGSGKYHGNGDRFLEIADTNNDGVIDKSEFNAMQDRRIKRLESSTKRIKSATFKKADLNNDGKIDKDEMIVHRNNMKSKANMRPKFSEMDANKNNYVSEKEFNKFKADRTKLMQDEGRQMRNMAKAPKFSDIDTNKDGKISIEEFENHQPIMQNRSGNRRGRGNGNGNGNGRGNRGNW
ncbi:MAG: EF-hand domain-containing protein [Ichthyobacteriaceae bacterium]|nr:EF-hand domain-containing protein [Ichthyobacteriaceae bacterium]